MRYGEKHSKLGKCESHKMKIIKVMFPDRDDFSDSIP